MKAFVLLSLALLPLLLQAPQASAPKQLLFEDFSGPALDRTVWNVVVTGRTVTTSSRPTSIRQT